MVDRTRGWTRSSWEELDRVKPRWRDSSARRDNDGDDDDDGHEVSRDDTLKGKKEEEFSAAAETGGRERRGSSQEPDEEVAVQCSGSRPWQRANGRDYFVLTREWPWPLA